MHAILRRQPQLAVVLLGWANRWNALSRPARICGSVLIAFLLVLIVSGSVSVAHHRGVLPSSIRWWLVAAFAAGTAAGSRRRWRAALAVHRRGWMGAWPLPAGKLTPGWLVWLGAEILAIAAVPAILCGLLMATGRAGQIGLNFAGCGVGVLAGFGAARWPKVKDPAVEEAVALARLQDRPFPPFVGLSQLRTWQRRSIGRRSVRRWVIGMAPVLLMAPSQIGVQAAVQILLLVLGWPLYARAMAASLETLGAASRLLAATPLRVTALYRQLLPRPVVLSLCLAFVVAIDLVWLGFPAQWIAASAMLVLLFEGGRMVSRGRHARHTLEACARSAMSSGGSAAR